ncbi:MAG: HD domain-containing protein [Spirochaetaceae bacterium]|jgi:putative hydrolase of HD superfamily|nr:HD domain-containing protein [Spirochaetaceae bacterium]
MLNTTFVLKIFEGFSIDRWNDLVRPFDIIEMDKAGEKMVLAYIIGKFEEYAGAKVDWDWLVYSSLFDLLKKIALCDIKSPVQRMIRTEYPGEYKKLDQWVLDQYKNLIDQDLYGRFRSYLTESPAETTLTARIRRAAHKFSTQRELDMIAPVNEPERLQRIRKGVAADLVEYLDLRGVQELVSKQRPFDFLMCVEQLRFQIRWNQTPRVPKTSVLGHSFFVAVLTLLLGRECGVPLCPRRRFNNFFSGLFHDLPEAVTRDIISPVKRATGGLPEIIKNIEDKIAEKELQPLMEDFYRDELAYFSANEFDNRILENGLPRIVTFEELNGRCNRDDCSPVDGALVRSADQIAAFIEADQSIRYGTTSPHLVEGRDGLLQTYRDAPPINGFDIAEFFRVYWESY